MYRIWCEWDMGWGDTVFEYDYEAENVIEDADWEGMVGYTLEEVRDSGLVHVEALNVG